MLMRCFVWRGEKKFYKGDELRKVLKDKKNFERKMEMIVQIEGIVYVEVYNDKIVWKEMSMLLWLGV